MRHYLIACVLPFLLPYSVLADKSTQQYLTEGNHFLTSGQFNHALTSFDAAIRNEPDNYLTYFKRATAYLSLGRHSAAADDFTTLLALKPDFEKALLERAGIYLKQGNYDLAMQDLEKYMSKSKEKKAKTMLESTKKAQQELKKAKIEKEKGRFESCISLATSVSRISPLLANARLLRAQCHVALGEMDEAAGDFARVVQLNPNDPTLLILLTKINFYSLFEPQAALVHIKQCLHYDPEHKQCKALFKKIKKLDKDIQAIEKEIELKKFATASNRLVGTPSRQGILSQIDADMDLLEKQDVFTHRLPRKLHAKCYHLACTLYGKQNENEDKIGTWCSKALSLQEDDVDALVYRAQVYLSRKDYEAAVRDLEKANQVAEEGSLYRVRQLLQQAQQKHKLSKKRDYYKLLDVSPHADSREIKKAYRKKAHEWHPDKYSGELDKEQVERKMAEINQAYEVLSDPDKRQQYDNGFDPYDPEQGNSPFGGNTGGFSFHEGGFPFSNGFPFGGGGFPGGAEFKMHFQH